MRKVNFYVNVWFEKVFYSNWVFAKIVVRVVVRIDPTTSLLSWVVEKNIELKAREVSNFMWEVRFCNLGMSIICVDVLLYWFNVVCWVFVQFMHQIAV